MPTYELLEGRHAKGRGRTRKIYKKGDLITTPSDLLRFNDPRPGYAPKYRRVEGVPPSQKLGQMSSGPTNLTPAPAHPSNLPPPQVHGMETLEGMTIEELRKYAAEEEIDLGQAKTKAQILEAVKANLT